MARLSLSLLGPFKAALYGEPVTDWPSVKVRALLAYLAVEADRPHPREVLAGLLWPDYPERSAHTNLSNALSHLRTLLKDRADTQVRPYLLVDRETVQFDCHSDCWVDVVEFVDLSGLGDLTGLEQAVSLYRGPFLEGFSLHDSPPFEQWALVTRERLQRQAMETLSRLAALQEQQGEYERALATARRQLEIEPWQERAHQAVMRLLALSGRRADALAQYEACCRVLKEELSVEPGTETTRLYERIRGGVAVSWAPLMASATPMHNLPAQSTPFVGRERELAELDRLLSDPQARLVTVLGPGGGGKTRLALEVAARQVGRYEHGVWFVSLAALQSVEGIVPAVAQAVGFQFSPGSDPRQQLQGYLREKRMLLVLDNWEHLLEGVTIVADILAAAPEVQVLATSRTHLGVQAEQLFQISGMEFPDWETPEDALEYGAVRLFIQSARRVQRGFQVRTEELKYLARICRLVEGMPLAILLAASWLGVLSLEEIATEVARGLDFLAADLRDVPERQRSMRAVFDYSWALLSEREREVFRALSVFRGGFTREAAEQVAGADLRLLASLVNKSLIVPAHRVGLGDRLGLSSRYDIHELLRQYGEEKLNGSLDGGQAVHDQHAAYYAQLLYSQRWARDWVVPGEAAETDNARAALRWAIESNRAGWIRQLLYCLVLLYQSEWRLLEGRGCCDEAMLVLRAVEPTGDGGIALAVALMGYARCSFLAGQPAPLLELYQESQTLLRRSGAQEELAWCNIWTALADLYPADRSRELLGESLEISTRMGQPGLTYDTLLPQAWNAMARGAYEEAEQCGQRALQLSREAGQLEAIEWSLTVLGNVAYLTSDYVKAGRYYEERLACTGEPLSGIARGGFCNDLGDVALALGEYEQARKHYEQGLARPAGLVDYRSSVCALWGLGDVALALGEEVSARGYYQRALQVALETPDGTIQAGALIGPCALLARRGSAERAVEVLTLVVEIGPYPIAAYGKVTRLLQALQSELPPGVFVAAQERGRALDLQTTARKLLAELEG